ncbi:MAG TPA: hypothetical protein VFZ53_28565 [Polyangiaceae bacterium]
MLYVDLAAVPAGSSVSAEGACNDGEDNDGDGFTDGDDWECAVVVDSSLSHRSPRVARSTQAPEPKSRARSAPWR